MAGGIKAPEIAGGSVMVVDEVLHVLTFFQVGVKLGVLFAVAMAAAVICLGTAGAAVYAAVFFAGSAAVCVVEALAAVRAEVCLIFLVVFAHALAAFAGSAAACGAAGVARVNAGLAHVVVPEEEAAAVLAGAVEPIAALDAEIAILAACQYGVEFAAFHAQAAGAAGLQMLACKVSLSLNRFIALSVASGYFRMVRNRYQPCFP